MKKQTRISLMLLVTLMLTLALTIPGLARGPKKTIDCEMIFPVFNNANDTVITGITLTGELEFMGWVGDTLINTCTGVIPYGESLVGQGPLTWSTYEDLAAFGAWQWSPESAVSSSDTVDLWIFLGDNDGTVYQATYWEVTAYPDGSYEWSKFYTP